MDVLVRGFLWIWVLGSSKQYVASSRFLQEDESSAIIARTLDDAAFLVREASCGPLDETLEGALVHLTCPLEFATALGKDDPLLQGVPRDQRMGFQLESYTQIFQWYEEAYTKKVGKRNVRDFLYYRDWLARIPKANTTFWGEGRKCPPNNNGYDCLQFDPSQVESWWNESGYTIEADWTIVDTLRLETNDTNDTLVRAGDYVIPMTPAVLESLLQSMTPQRLQPACLDGSITGNGVDDNPTTTPCTDVSIQQTDDGDPYAAWQQLDSNGERMDYLVRSYQLYTTDVISILAVQQGDSFVPWEYYDGSTIRELFQFTPGTHTATQMIEVAKASSASSLSIHYKFGWRTFGWSSGVPWSALVALLLLVWQ